MNSMLEKAEPQKNLLIRPQEFQKTEKKESQWTEQLTEQRVRPKVRKNDRNDRENDRKEHHETWSW